jgi:hypothetical protein
MNKHPLLRAYLAGIAVPTVFLLVVMTVYTFVRYVYNLPVPIERVIVFPMAFVPNLWGLWNVLHTAYFAPRHVSLGLFGGLLPLLLAPLGYCVARLLDFPIPPHVLNLAPVGLPIGMILYYLAWKYFVSGLNLELGIA